MAISLDSLRKAVKKNKGRSQAMAWLADMERASGDYEAALKTVDAALAASPSDVPAMLVRAKILAGQQDFAGSITEYKKVLAKDPFCLSAHKRMGESYDKLGKEAERNACFRRVHDMDPLDPFWKDEYDVLTEEEQASLVAPPMDDSSFTMDVSDDTENADAGEDNIFANLAASLPNTDEEDNSSMEALRNSLNFASDEITKGGDEVQDASFDGHALNSSEVSSAISDILGGDDDLDVVDSPKNNESAAEESSSSSLFSHFSDDEEKLDVVEEPKSEDIVEEKSDDVEFSLDSLDGPLDADEKTTNVDDAFSSLLGDDELPEETPAAEKAAETPVSETIEEPAAETLEEPKEEDSAAEEVDGAFDALFGDDEAPAEESSAEETVAEEPVAEQPKEENLAEEMGGAFASMFGDEKPVEESPAEESLSQEATSAVLEEKAVNEDVEKSVDESFDSIFGSDADDLPEEKSEAAEVPAEVAAEEPTSVFSAPADTLEEPASEQLEEPAAEPAEQVAEEVAPSAELDSIDSEVSNAFKGLFDEDDSLPESDEPNNNGVDYLMSGDSDDEVAASLVENADAPLSRGAADLDDSLNTRTLADIYMEQGVYDKALDIYTDLAKKNPDNEEIKSRLEEVKKLCRDKFGEV